MHLSLSRVGKSRVGTNLRLIDLDTLIVYCNMYTSRECMKCVTQTSQIRRDYADDKVVCAFHSYTYTKKLSRFLGFSKRYKALWQK